MHINNLYVAITEGFLYNTYVLVSILIKSATFMIFVHLVYPLYFISGFKHNVG